MQLASVVGREKSQVSRTLKALEAAGFVARDPDTRRYRLGWRVFTIAVNAANQHLLTCAPGVLRHLVARVHETAHLSVREGTQLLTLVSESPGWAIQVGPWVGRVAPLHCTSAGRALLFDHTDADVRALLAETDFAGWGPRAPRHIGEVLTRLHSEQQRGYATVDQEFEAGHVSVAAPVRDFRGHVIAALNVSAPKFRLGRSLHAAGRHVQAAADHLSRELVTAPATRHPAQNPQP